MNLYGNKKVKLFRYQSLSTFPGFFFVFYIHTWPYLTTDIGMKKERTKR